MKLIDPTDRQLDEAFTEHISKWRPTEDQIQTWILWAKVSGQDESREVAEATARGADRPCYCGSMDAVLPWLEKQPYPDIGRVANGDWKVMFYLNVDTGGKEKEEWAIDKSLPRATVIALLRANGIEVEFTK